MRIVAFALFLLLAVLSYRGARWAYIAFVILGLLWFPVRSGFHFGPPPCEWTFDLRLAVYSLTNYAHVLLFINFFLMTQRQLRDVKGALLWSALACLVMGFLIELDEGATGTGHCRMRDLVPDSAGALIGAAIFSGWRWWRLRRNGI